MTWLEEIKAKAANGIHDDGDLEYLIRWAEAAGKVLERAEWCSECEQQFHRTKPDCPVLKLLKGEVD